MLGVRSQGTGLRAQGPLSPLIAAIIPGMQTIRLLWVVAALAFVPRLNAAEWVPIGPWGGEVVSVAVGQNGSPVYAATEGGLYKSIDAKDSWTPVYKTAPARIEQLAMDPNDASVVYISTFERMYRSIDGGALWSAVSDETAEALFVDTASIVYASFPSKRVMKSADRGSTWAAANDGLPGGVTKIDGAGGVMYAAASALYKTSDGGATWASVLAPPQSITTVTVDRRTPTTVYAGSDAVYRSTDGGAAWTKLSGGLPSGDSVAAIAPDPSDANRVYAAFTSAGLARSSDGGTIWQIVGGTAAYVPTAIAFLPSELLLGTAHAGVMSSSDGGDHFGDASRGISLADTTILLPSGDELYAGAANIGLHVTADGGNSWARLDPSPSPQDLVVDQAAPSILYLAGGDGVLRRSADGGQTWTPAGLNDASAVTANGSTLLATVANEVYRTTDSGSTWLRAYTSPRFTTVTKLAMDPASPSTVYANTRPVSMTNDGGGTWSPTSADAAATLFVLPGPPSLVYLGADTVYRTTSGSGEWTRSAQGLPDGVRIADFAWDDAAQLLYVAFSPPATTTVVSQIYMSNDRGSTWSPLATQPRDVWVKSLAVFNKTLFAGTSAGLLALQSDSSPARKRAIRR